MTDRFKIVFKTAPDPDSGMLKMQGELDVFLLVENEDGSAKWDKVTLWRSLPLWQFREGEDEAKSVIRSQIWADFVNLVQKGGMNQVDENRVIRFTAISPTEIFVLPNKEEMD